MSLHDHFAFSADSTARIGTPQEITRDRVVQEKASKLVRSLPAVEESLEGTSCRSIVSCRTWPFHGFAWCGNNTHPKGDVPSSTDADTNSIQCRFAFCAARAPAHTFDKSPCACVAQKRTTRHAFPKAFHSPAQREDKT